MHRLQVISALLLLLGLAPHASYGQNSAGANPAAPPIIDKTPQAGDDDDPEPQRKAAPWNEFDGKISTVRLGFGFLTDFVAYRQDDTSKKQVGDLSPAVGVRDFRLLARGRFKTERPFSWTVGYMYDGADNSWRFRQTGVEIGFPEAYGRVFIGRTKEGYSMIKVMTGYHPWTMERTHVLDAFIPILADGVKWMGYLPKPRVFYSLGLFGDQVSENEKFATYDNQVVSRVTWLPILSEPQNKLWHIGVMGRVGKPDNGSLQDKSKPEDNLAPNFVDTGKIPAKRATTTGFESFYRQGPWLFGGEYDWQRVDTTDGQHPVFQGGNAAAVWIITGETRGYNLQGAFFHPVSPKKSVFAGGPGAVEAVVNLSYADFDSGNFHGGKLARLTPMVNWYLSDNVRLEFVYGYSLLDRFDLNGRTQFFQSRIQLTL